VFGEASTDPTNPFETGRKETRMNPTLPTRKGALGVAIVLFAVLTALAVLLASKPSQAQAVDVVSVDPTSVDFGSLDVSADPATRRPGR
jgi:hypothetical protein